MMGRPRDYEHKISWFEVWYAAGKDGTSKKTAMRFPGWSQQEAEIGAQAVSSALRQRVVLYRMEAELMQVKKGWQYVITRKEVVLRVCCLFPRSSNRQFIFEKWLGVQPTSYQPVSIPAEAREAMLADEKIMTNL